MSTFEENCTKTQLLFAVYFYFILKIYIEFHIKKNISNYSIFDVCERNYIIINYQYVGKTLAIIPKILYNRINLFVNLIKRFK